MITSCFPEGVGSLLPMFVNYQNYYQLYERTVGHKLAKDLTWSYWHSGQRTHCQVLWGPTSAWELVHGKFKWEEFPEWKGISWTRSQGQLTFDFIYFCACCCWSNILYWIYCGSSEWRAREDQIVRNYSDIWSGRFKEGIRQRVQGNPRLTQFKREE